MADVTDKDREAYTAADSHEASALLSALRNMHCDRPHSIFGPPCERCLSIVHDALAARLGVIRRQAREEGRREEREACAAWHESEADGAMLGPLDAYPAGVTPIEYAGLIAFHRRAARAIRARGEKGEY